MERDGFCISVTSKLNCFLPCDIKGHVKKSCVRLPPISDWPSRVLECTQQIILMHDERDWCEHM